MTLYTATITLMLIMDPLGNIPAFLAVLSHVSPQKRTRIIFRESIFALIILAFFLFFGQNILENMQISEPALSIAGGIILFLIAIRMIFPPERSEDKSREHDEPFIVPLAVPMIAGPSTMTMVMLLANQAPTQMHLWFLALVLAWSISTTLLLFAGFLRKLLGERGLVAVERLMGMILTTMAVQMFLSGIEKFFHLSP